MDITEYLKYEKLYQRKLPPERGTDDYNNQVETMTLVFECATSHQELDQIAFMYMLDLEYSRSAIMETLSKTEKKKGWKS